MYLKWAAKPKGPEDYHEEQASTTYVVYKPEQVHILGSEKDLKKLRKRLNTKK